MRKKLKFSSKKDMYLKHSAAIIIRDQKVLLIKRCAQEDSAPNKWCPPNETLEENETPESAVVRGVQEEIGLKFVIEKRLSDHFYGKHITFVFLGIGKGKIELNPKEASDYGWFSYQEAMGLEFAYDYQKVIQNLFDLNLIKN